MVAVPNTVFYDHREAGAPFVRFAFCKRTHVLEEAVGRLKALTGQPTPERLAGQPTRRQFSYCTRPDAFCSRARGSLCMVRM